MVLKDSSSARYVWKVGSLMTVSMNDQRFEFEDENALHGQHGAERPVA